MTCAHGARRARPTHTARRSQRQRRVGQQQRFPGEEQQHHTPRDGQPGNGGPRRLHITMERRAGSMAGSLTGLLRTHGSADVTFATIVSIFKCLRVLSLTNLFLSQHRASCVFSFAYEKPEQHQERVQRLIEYQHSPPKRGVVPSEQQQQEQQQQQASTAGGGQEPVPRLPSSVFRLHTWSRNLPEEGLQQPWGGRSGHVAAAAAAQQQQQGEAGPREQVSVCLSRGLLPGGAGQGGDRAAPGPTARRGPTLHRH